MNKKEDKIYKELMLQYKWQWDKNQYARTNYDSDLESYRGYIDTADYPLVYNTSFNRILPIIYTILSRFMDQLYQTGNIVSVKPRKRKDIERAKMAESILNFQMENLNSFDMQGGSWLTMYKWMFNALTFGKGIVKAYWRKEERITPRRLALPMPNFDMFGNFQGMDTLDFMDQQWGPIYDGPYVEVLHNKLFVPHPEYKNIQQMPYVFIVYKRSMDEIKRMADKGIYKNINEIGYPATGHASGLEQDSREAFIKSLAIEAAFQTTDAESELKPPEVDILECYGKIILGGPPYEVGSGVKIKGMAEEVIAHIGNYRTLLSLQRNKYGARPLFDMGCYMHPELYWDLGMVTLTKGIQQHVDSLANLRIQNAYMMINPMLKVNYNSDIDPEALVWKPFGLVPVDDMHDVEPLIIPDTNSNLFMEQEMFYKNAIHDIMGMYPMNMGESPNRAERVGTITSIQSMGEARAKLLLMSMDYLGIRPFLRFLMLLNTFHLPSGYEYRIADPENQQFGKVFGPDLHPDFDFAARYTAMEPALGKQFRSQQLISMAQLWKQDPWINQYQMNKTLMELLDIRESEQLLKDPKQFQQEMMQRQQQAMQQVQAQQKAEVQGKIAKSKADSQGRIQKSMIDNKAMMAKEKMESDTDIQVQQMKTTGDLMLEALKQEAAE